MAVSCKKVELDDGGEVGNKVGDVGVTEGTKVGDTVGTTVGGDVGIAEGWGFGSIEGDKVGMAQPGIAFGAENFTSKPLGPLFIL